MGNYRFKLSDMIPNAWFYKLKDMGKTGNKKQTQTTTPSRKKKQLSSSQTSTTTQSSKPKQPHQQCTPRKSYYFTRDLKVNQSNKLSTTPHPNSPELPRKSSSKQRTKAKTPPRRSTCSPKLVSSTVSAGCSCRTTVESVWTKSYSPPEYSSSPFDSSAESESPDPEFRTDRVLPTESSFDEMVSLSTSSCTCKTKKTPNPTTNDVVIDVDKNSLPRKDDKLNNGYEQEDAVSELELELPPIVTKPPKIPNKTRTSVAKHEGVKEKEQRNSVRRLSVSSPGVKLRVNSPRIGGRRVVYNGRKSVSSSSSTSSSRRSLSDSFAIVKASFNPQKDFRESMVEMIVENNIRASKDLEDLLACYLSLNSDEYHDLIIKVFKQIWFDLTETR